MSDPNTVEIPLLPWEVPADDDGGDNSGTPEEQLNDSLLEALGSDDDSEQPQGDGKPAGGKRKRTPDPEGEDDTEDEDDDLEEDDVEDEEESDVSEESDEDDTDEEEDEDDADDTEEEVIEISGRRYTVKQLEELDRRGLRQADYTRKTTEVATLRKQAEKVISEYGAMRDALASQLEQVEMLLSSMMPEEPDWEKLYAENPERFAAEYAAHEMRQKQLNAVKARRKQLYEEQAAALREQIAMRTKDEAEKFVAAVAEWKDEKVAAREKKALHEYLLSDGYTDADLETVVDHRPMLYALKAMRYDELQNRKDKLRKKVAKKKVLKPGSRVTVTGGEKSARRKAVARKQAKLAQSGRAEDFADLLVEEFGDML